MHDLPPAFARNTLLSRLPLAERASLSIGAEEIAVTRGQILFEPGDHVQYAFFPMRGCVLSLMIDTPDGKIAEVAVVGHEGALGGVISAGRKPAFARAVTQIEGSAIRIDHDRLEKVKAASPIIRDLFERFADALLAQVLQSVACNALHTLEQRTARWLLTARSRADADDFPLTHEMLAAALGVQRTYVTTMVRKLQARGLIGMQRGHMSVMDPEGLRRTACVCFDEVEAHYARVLPALV